MLVVYHFQSGVTPGVVTANGSEVQVVAFLLKANALSKVANRLRLIVGIDRLEVIQVHLDIGGRVILIPAVQGTHQLQVRSILCQGDGNLAPAIVVELGGGVTAGQIFKDEYGVLIRIGNISCEGIKGDGRTGRKRLAELHPEHRPQAGCTGKLQGVLAAVCGSGHTGLLVADHLQGGISPGVFAANRLEVQLIACLLKANALIEITRGLGLIGRIDRLQIINVDLHQGAVGRQIPAVHGANQVQIAAIVLQGNGQLVPTVVCILGSGLAAAHILINGHGSRGAVGNIPGIGIKGDLGAGCQGSAKIQAEDRPVALFRGQPQSVFAAVFRHRQIRVGVADPVENGIAVGFRRIIRVGEEAHIAQNFEVKALENITYGGDGRLAGDSPDIINVYLSGSFFRGDLCPVVVPEQIHILCAGGQLYRQFRPLIALKLLRGLTAGREFEDALVVYAGALGNSGIGHKGQLRTCRQNFTEVDAEGRPEIAVMAQPQGIFLTAVQLGNIGIGVGDALDGGITPLVSLDLLAYEVSRIAGDLKAQAVPEAAFRLHRRYRLHSDHIVDVNLTDRAVGGDLRPVVVPEQIHIAGSHLQSKVQLDPLITQKLDGGLTAAGKLKDTLVINALTVDPGIGHKADHGVGRQLLAEIDPEGRPEVGVVADAQGILAAVFQGRNVLLGIGQPVNDSIVVLALTGEQQLMAGGLKIQALKEIDGNGLRLLALFEIGTDQVIDIQGCNLILPALLMGQKIDDQVPHIGKVINGEACHGRKVVGTGGPAFRVQCVGLLDGGHIVAVILTHIDTCLDQHLLLRCVVHIEADAGKLRKITGSTGGIQKIQLQEGVQLWQTVVTLGLDHQRACTLGDISRVCVNAHFAKGVAHGDLGTGHFLVGVKAQ